MKSSRRPAQLGADVEGASAVEFAIVLSLLSTLLFGLVDYGTGLWEAMVVGNAARAGAFYAALNGWNSTSITAAVTGATELSSSSSCPLPSTTYNTISACPAPSQVCACPSATLGLVAPPSPAPTPPNCSAKLCSDGVTPAGYYVQVNAKANYSTIIPWPGFS